ncbi:MAG: DMT family transporter [Chitinophagales bacterium]
MRSPAKAHLFIFLANLLYGINYSVGKIALQSIGPFTIVFYRVVGAAILFSLLHQIFIREKTEAKDHLKLALAALFGVAINQLLFFKGLSLTSETHAALIMITTPIIVLVMAWFLLKDPITIFKSLGIGLGAIGVYLLIHSGARQTTTDATVAGDLCVMINATSYAIFLVLAKPLMQKYHPLTIAKWIFLFGVLFVLPFGLPPALHVDYSLVPAEAYYAMIYVILGTTVLAYMFNIFGLHYGDPALVSVYIYLQPIIATLIAILFGTDSLHWQFVLSSLFVFTGVAFVSRKKGINRNAS